MRESLVTAAQEIFASEGYAGASTRNIANSAGVSDVLIYRHFGSKWELFEKAVLAPINQFMGEYMATWAEHEAGTERPEDLASRWVRGLYPLLHRHRGLLMAFLSAAQGSHGELTQTSPFDTLLKPGMEVVAAESAAHGMPGIDGEMTARVAFSLILGVILLGDQVFATSSSRPDEDMLMREIELFIHHRVFFTGT